MSNVGNDNVAASLDKARTELDDAITEVARAADLLADGASVLRHYQTYRVDWEDMSELKEALKVWKQATQNFLSEVAKAGG